MVIESDITNSDYFNSLKSSYCNKLLKQQSLYTQEITKEKMIKME